MSKTDIEHWLRQTLDGFEPSAPENAWDRLEPRLPQKKRRRGVLFYFMWMGGIGLLASGAWWLNRRKQSLPPSTESKYTTHSGAIARAADLQPSKDQKITQESVLNIIQLNAKQPAPNRTGKAEDLSTKTNSALPLLVTASIALPQQNIAATTPMVFNLRPMERLQSLILPVQLHQFNPSISPLATAHSTVSALKARIYWSIEAAPMLFYQKTGQQASNALVFTEHSVHPGQGWQYGFHVGVQTKRPWRFIMGLQYVQQNRETSHQATLRLMDGVCLNPYDPGLKQYEFQYGLISGDQRSELTLQLQQQTPGSHMALDESFTLDMHTTRHLRSILLPLTVERHFGKGNWQGFVEAGAIMDVATKNSLEVTHYDEFCQDLCFANGLTPKIAAKSTNLNVFGWRLGLGVERRLTHHTLIRLEPFVAGKKYSWQGGLSLGLVHLH
jgi:hypothetical protein